MSQQSLILPSPAALAEHPQVAIGAVSRDELVNLLIEEYVARVHTEAETLNVEATGLDQQLVVLAQGVYQQVYDQVTTALRPRILRIAQAFKSTGVERTAPEVKNVAALEDLKFYGGEGIQGRGNHVWEARRSGTRSVEGRESLHERVQAVLCEHLGRGPVHGIDTAQPWRAQIECAGAKEHESAWLTIPLKVVVAVPPEMIEFRARWMEVSQRRHALLATIDEEALPVLHRKMLAALTRSTLAGQGAKLDVEGVLGSLKLLV